MCVCVCVCVREREIEKHKFQVLKELLHFRALESLFLVCLIIWKCNKSCTILSDNLKSLRVTIIHLCAASNMYVFIWIDNVISANKVI